MKLTLLYSLLLQLLIHVEVSGQVSLNGQWKTDVVEMKSAMPDHIKSVFDSLNIDVRNEIVNYLANQTFEFSSNGDYQAEKGNSTLSGIWSAQSDSLHLELTNGKSLSYKIEELSQNQVIIQIISDSTSLALFHKLILKKE